MLPQSTPGNGPTPGGIGGMLSISVRQSWWAMIVVGPKKQFPLVWSRCECVLMRVRTGAAVTDAIASRYARVRRSVEDASTLTTLSLPTRKPVLLRHQPPSGWM